jgi:hypothetical protein
MADNAVDVMPFFDVEVRQTDGNSFRPYICIERIAQNGGRRKKINVPSRLDFSLIQTSWAMWHVSMGRETFGEDGNEMKKRDITENQKVLDDRFDQQELNQMKKELRVQQYSIRVQQ